MSGFYVGYSPKAPTDLASFVRRVVSAMLLLVAMLGPLLIISQQRFGASAFEWQQVRTFQGVVQESPYPTLLVRRPGIANPGEEFSRYLLVGVGKHGASSEMSKFDGNTVSLQGKLIYRDGQTLIEVMPASVSVVNSNPSKATKARYLGKVSLQGEIVDSKCYLGVMNPGHGKVHRDCAVRCIS